MRSATLAADQDLTGRARIREAAMALFAARGVEATSLRAVAREADVSPALVVHHFGSKQGLAEAVDEAVALLGHPAMTLRMELDETAPAVLAYRPALVQAIANLIGNAVKFVAAGTEPEVRVRAEPRADAVRLWVEDNGIGIAPEHQDRVFQAFERLHAREQYPGSGIGLAVVKRVIERMGGGVGVESTPGRGSGFWIELPPAGGPAPGG
jgi:signal transduction histidine kinase